MEPPYDHRDKSGNEGDVVKHVALVAALDAVLARWGGGFFRYADTFAGYAFNPLVGDGAWRRGVGRLIGEGRLDDNPHTALWRRWYLSRPMARGGAYPGSSLVAADVARHHETPIHLALWDVSVAVVENLRATWGDRALVFDRAAAAEHREVEQAHFLFIDPPDLDAWADIETMLEQRREGGTLLWLPALRGVEDEALLIRMRALGYRRTTIRWPGTSTTVGCHLVYRVPETASAALEAAVRHVADVAGWRAEDPA